MEVPPPSGLGDVLWRFRGLTPTATMCRRFATEETSPRKKHREPVGPLPTLIATTNLPKIFARWGPGLSRSSRPPEGGTPGAHLSAILYLSLLT